MHYIISLFCGSNPYISEHYKHIFLKQDGNKYSKFNLNKIQSKLTHLEMVQYQ